MLGGAVVATVATFALTAGHTPSRASNGSGRVAVSAPSPTTTTAPTSGQVALVGCPVPSHPPLPPSPPPWHPAVLVTSLPPVAAPAPWTSHLADLTGKGMWIWEWNSSDGGDADEIVQQAVSAGLHQLWIRVGDSMNGFYGAGELDDLVPVAHAHGIAVIAWGFPYLWNPVNDAQWTAQILNWRAPDGQQVDGYSADIEEETEGVMLSAQRAAVYLELVRQAAGSRLVVATVYPPTDADWDGGYPYGAMAPYIDAFAPMVYWECTEPSTDAALDVARLSTLRPVDVIGEAFNFADVGGRTVSPSGAEITAFLSASQRAGALGASFWVWQEATSDEWAALSTFPWSAVAFPPMPSRVKGNSDVRANRRAFPVKVTSVSAALEPYNLEFTNQGVPAEVVTFTVSSVPAGNLSCKIDVLRSGHIVGSTSMNSFSGGSRVLAESVQVAKISGDTFAGRPSNARVICHP